MILFHIAMHWWCFYKKYFLQKMKTITVQFDTWRRGWADQCGLEDGEQVIPWLTIVHLSGQFMNATDVNTEMTNSYFQGSAMSTEPIKRQLKGWQTIIVRFPNPHYYVVSWRIWLDLTYSDNGTRFLPALAISGHQIDDLIWFENIPVLHGTMILRCS